ncbi:hypothetical protein SELMODRAFT_426517 [Selaginella moellendorffii]|uniref:Uncharacterized protein n=1 Tax=Selaginella moellendorffii TaxID=88036 RepID=D8SWL7_SELML|nr:hypothetical protein SELMODRAFT_426517 [Selaginella moellendorffii]
MGSDALSNHHQAQFVSLAADQSGEIICAGTRIPGVLGFLVTGQNRAPVDVFEGKGRVENFTHTHDVLTVVYCSDGKQLGCSTLDGQIHFWDPIDGVLMGTIEGRRARANALHDGSLLLAGGTSNYICMYDAADQALLQRLQISHSYSLDGVLDFLNSKRMTAAVRGKLAQDAAGPIMCTKCVRISPTGSSGNNGKPTQWTTLFLIPVDVEPEAINDALESKRYSQALMLALRLNKPLLIQKCMEAVDISVISAVVCNVSLSYLGDALAQYLEKTPHLEFLLVGALHWQNNPVEEHGAHARFQVPILQQQLPPKMTTFSHYLCSAPTKSQSVEQSLDLYGEPNNFTKLSALSGPGVVGPTIPLLLHVRNHCLTCVPVTTLAGSTSWVRLAAPLSCRGPWGSLAWPSASPPPTGIPLRQARHIRAHPSSVLATLIQALPHLKLYTPATASGTVNGSPPPLTRSAS